RTRTRARNCPCNAQNRRSPPLPTNNRDTVAKTFKAASGTSARSSFCRIYLHRSASNAAGCEGRRSFSVNCATADCKSGSEVFNNESVDANCPANDGRGFAGNAVLSASYKECRKRSLREENGIGIANQCQLGSYYPFYSEPSGANSDE